MKYTSLTLLVCLVACQKMEKKVSSSNTLVATTGSVSALVFDSLTINGDSLVLYDENFRPCDNSYLPDAPARAFRNAQNQIVLLAPNFKNRAMVGTAFASMAHDCRIRYAAGNRPSPDSLDDRSWLHAFYTEDGTHIFGLVSASFIPYRHGMLCGAGTGSTDCWINGIASVQSTNAGDTFTYPAAVPKHIFMAPPIPYDSMVAVQPSYVSVTNFVPWHDSLFAMVWRRNATGIASFNCLIKAAKNDLDNWYVLTNSGYQLMSTLNGSSGWTLNSFTPKAIPVLSRNVRALVLHEPTQTFIAIFQDRVNNIPGFYYSTSQNLQTWTTRKMLYPGEARSTASGTDAYEYPSLLDENSTDRNFGLADDSLHLFFTKFDYTGSSYKRLLLAVPLHVASH
jgi:hypothetical protein